MSIPTSMFLPLALVLTLAVPLCAQAKPRKQPNPNAGSPDASTDWTHIKSQAEQGDAEAQFNLGFCYARGEGVPQSDAEAYIWFSLASARGMENAAKSRDIAAENLSPQALARAQARAAKLHAEIEARKK